MAERNDNPATWDDLNPEADGWVKWEEGQEIQGRVVNRILTKRKSAETGRRIPAYFIELTKPGLAIPSDSDGDEPEQLNIGDIVGITESAKLRRLADCKGAEVFIKAEEKVILDNGNPMWKMVVKVRGPRQAFPPLPGEIDSANNSDDADDIPF